MFFDEIGDTCGRCHWLSYHLTDTLLKEFFALLIVLDNGCQFVLEFRKGRHRALHPLPVVLLHYIDPKVGYMISKLLRNNLLELPSSANYVVLKVILANLLRLNNFFPIRL